MGHHPISRRSQSKFGHRPRVCSTHSSHSSAVCRAISTSRPRPSTPVRLRRGTGMGYRLRDRECAWRLQEAAWRTRRAARAIVLHAIPRDTWPSQGQQFLARDRPFRFPNSANAWQSRGFLSVLPGGPPSGSALRSPFAHGIPCSACAVAHQRDII